MIVQALENFKNNFFFCYGCIVFVSRQMPRVLRSLVGQENGVLVLYNDCFAVYVNREIFCFTFFYRLNFHRFVHLLEFIVQIF